MMIHALLQGQKLLLDEVGAGISFLLAPVQGILPDTPEAGDTMLHILLHGLHLLLDEVGAGIGFLLALLQATLPHAFEIGYLLLYVLFQRLKLLTKATGLYIGILPTLAQTLLEIAPDAIQIIPHLGVQVCDGLEGRILVLLQGVLALIKARFKGEPHLLQAVIHIPMHLFNGTQRVITIIF